MRWRVVDVYHVRHGRRRPTIKTPETDEVSLTIVGHATHGARTVPVDHTLRVFEWPLKYHNLCLAGLAELITERLELG